MSRDNKREASSWFTVQDEREGRSRSSPAMLEATATTTVPETVIERPAERVESIDALVFGPSEETELTEAVMATSDVAGSRGPRSIHSKALDVICPRAIVTTALPSMSPRGSSSKRGSTSAVVKPMPFQSLRKGSSQRLIALAASARAMLKPLQNASSVADEDDNAISRRCSVSSISIDMPSAETRQKLLMRWVRQWLPIAPVVGRPEQQVSTNEVFPLASGNGTGDWHPLTINHESMYKDAWDTVVIIVVVADAFIAPFAASFDYNTSAVTAFANLETLVYGLDMVVQMMSSYTDEHGTVITGPRKTIPHYGTCLDCGPSRTS